MSLIIYSVFITSIFILLSKKQPWRHDQFNAAKMNLSITYTYVKTCFMNAEIEQLNYLFRQETDFNQIMPVYFIIEIFVYARSIKFHMPNDQEFFKFYN